MLCTRGKYWSVWLIIPTMIFSQHFTAWLLQHQQMWNPRRKQINHYLLSDPAWVLQTFSHDFAPGLTRAGVPRRLPRADRKYQLITVRFRPCQTVWCQARRGQPKTLNSKTNTLTNTNTPHQAVSFTQYVDYFRMTTEIDTPVWAQWHELTEKCPLNTWLLMLEESQIAQIWNAQLYAVEVLKNHWGNYRVRGDNV